MSGVLNGVKNATGMPAISAARSIIYRPDSGLPFQLFFDTLNKDIYVDQSNGWELFTSGPGKYTFGSGLTNTAGTVTNNLTTGKSAGNIIFGFDDDLSGSGLQLWSAIETGINSNYILFGSWDDNGTAYFSNTGAWNFGAETDPSLTTPYLYVFQSRGVFNARWDFNANIALLNTTGSHIQSVWQTSAPTGNANQTHLFFDSVGSPSFRIGTNNWFKFTPNTLTANRNYILRDSNYTLAGTDIDNSFSVAQTFIAGSAATTSINFGTAGTGIYGSSSQRIDFATSGVSRMYIDSTIGIVCQSIISANGGISMGSGLTSYSTATIRGGAGSPEGVYNANVGSLFLRTNGGANTTLYVKESGTGNTGWVAK